ncbi:MAG: hypothetical protein SFU25_03890 [Candidatus Caenarcaniphilales bacterium]|nr:hypothetical protein [Candidatus Caenarcaniphilales bacterium]
MNQSPLAHKVGRHLQSKKSKVLNSSVQKNCTITFNSSVASAAGAGTPSQILSKLNDTQGSNGYPKKPYNPRKIENYSLKDNLMQPIQQMSLGFATLASIVFGARFAGRRRLAV